MLVLFAKEHSTKYEKLLPDEEGQKVVFREMKEMEEKWLCSDLAFLSD